jgi:hypothetical protein
VRSIPKRSNKVLLRSETGTPAGVVQPYAGTLALCKSVTPKEHQLRQPPAWAEDAAALRRAEELGATLAVFEAKDQTCRWIASLQAFRRYGFEFDRGHGQQVGLALRHWRVEDSRTPQLPLFENVGR